MRSTMVRRDREETGESLFLQDGQHIYVQDGNLVLNYMDEEDDEAEGNEGLYYIINQEK